MGLSYSTVQPVVYSQAVNTKQAGETEIRRAPEVFDELLTRPADNITNLQNAWLDTVKRNGSSAYIFKRNSKGEYKSKTYAEIHALAQNLGAAVLDLNLAPEKNEYADITFRPVGIYAKNREEWLIADIGCAFLYGMTMVPLYDTLGKENIQYCIEHSGMEVIFCSSASVNNLMKEENLSQLKNIICFDTITEEQKTHFEGRNIKLHGFQDMISHGSKNPQELPEVNPEQIFTFSYTSGTTGRPKAAMLTHANFISTMTNFLYNPSQKAFIEASKADNVPIVHLSYLPLPHVMERYVCTCITYLGGQLHMYSGDVLKLKDDLRDVKPTIFVSVPRLYNKFYDVINSEFKKQPAHRRFLINTAIKAKLQNLYETCSYDHQLWDELIFKKIKETFGGRVRFMLSGSAPLSKDVLNFFQIAIGAPLLEGYGQTESVGGSFSKHYLDPVTGHVGGPFCNTEFKLVDIPEMNYLSTDKDAKGNTHARGEICLRGPCVFKGYYKDEAKTNEAIDKDGWLHTGDVGRLEYNTTRLYIIDRKKNIFKLSQGEYVAPEKVENIYKKVIGIEDIFVHGDSLQSYCVGIVSLSDKFLEELKNEIGLPADATKQEISQNKDVKQKVIKILNAQGKQDNLYGFEQVRSIYIEYRPFQELGCYTATQKLQRHLLKDIFAQQIADMYKE